MCVLIHTWFNFLGLESFFPTRPITYAVCPAVTGWSQGWRKDLASPITLYPGQGKALLELEVLFLSSGSPPAHSEPAWTKQGSRKLPFIPPKGVQIQILLK